MHPVLEYCFPVIQALVALFFGDWVLILYLLAVSLAVAALKVGLPLVVGDQPWMRRPKDAPAGLMTNGLPSGHMAAATFFGYYVAFRWLGFTGASIALGTTYAFLVGALRVYHGAHTPKQVLWGFVLGTLFVFHAVPVLAIPTLKNSARQVRRRT